MKKYDIPLMEVRKFFSENLFTTSTIDSEYIDEVQTVVGIMSSDEYVKRMESIKSILTYTD